MPRHLALMCLLIISFTFAQAQSGAPAASTPGPANTRIGALLDELAHVRTPVTAAISPDGASIAWAYKGQGGSELHLAGVTPKTPQDRILSPDTFADVNRTHPGRCTAAHPVWSPSGLELAFLSNCSGTSATPDASGQENSWLWTPATNAMRQISHLHGAISDLQWSPDGRSLGFLFVENATRQAGALAAMKPPSGVIGEDGVEIQRVSIIDPATGGTWQVSPPNLHVYEFTWAPNSHELAYIAAAPPGENNWWSARLYTQPWLFGGRSGSVTMEAAEKATPVFDPTTNPGPLHGLQIAVPRFSPDGKTIAFIGGLMSDQGSIGGDIYLIPVSGQAANTPQRDLTPNRPASPAWIEWRNDHELLVSEHRGGDSHITAINVNTGKDDPEVNMSFPETIIAGVDIMSLSTARNGSMAMIRQSYDHPAEVWAGPLAGLKQISHLNDGVKPQWGKAESVTWTNDGFNLQGWLLYPAAYNPSKRYPLIVSVHGGPSSAIAPRWPEAAYGAVPFSALGYFVFMPNPRGSYGQGEKFTQANIKDFGYGDLRDILAGLDVLEKRFPIDKDREGVTGWSYGGFMTMFAVTQTNRFHAAVAGAGIANWQSYYGENSIDQWMLPFFGATVYDNPEVYARSSAINYIKNVKTPTLVVVGDRDGECPMPQSFEFWHALRDEGVKTRLVIYSNEGHRFVDPAHKRDVLERALEWFEEEMPAER
jgi:dipeptidyl aminopeptidase/acylaminoacyl peptidase